MKDLSLTSAVLLLITVAGATLGAIQGARAIDQQHRVAECIAQGWDPMQCQDVRPGF